MLSLEVVDVDGTRRRKRIRYKVTPSANYAAGGDVVDFTAATNPKNLAGAFMGRFPVATEVAVIGNLNGGQPDFVVGTTLANAKVKLLDSLNTEHAAGAYTAGELADTFMLDVTQPVGGGAQ